MDTSLSQLVKVERSLGNRYIRILALDVAYGINYLDCFQPNPILHRDVNSGNVMVWRQGDKWRGKLCDFGSAEFMGSKMSPKIQGIRFILFRRQAVHARLLRIFGSKINCSRRSDKRVAEGVKVEQHDEKLRLALNSKEKFSSHSQEVF
ncbi:unnamed protein product [Porites evermanni]|uniref:Protein kinase domain-containing protein n=1 Tax=Porites evermanni TaxID=104178 RepID=A0ABN8RH01_9CNID|nr:unnamed protein product [Porites evermanni]